MENGRFAFLSVGEGGGATYDDHLRLFGKREVDFLLVWTFFVRCYGWGAASEYQFKIGDFAPTRSIWPKISDRRDRPRPTILLLIKLGWTDFFPFCHTPCVCQTDRQTDGRTDSFLLTRPPCVQCSAVKRWRRLSNVWRFMFIVRCDHWRSVIAGHCSRVQQNKTFGQLYRRSEPFINVRRLCLSLNEALSHGAFVVLYRSSVLYRRVSRRTVAYIRTPVSK